MNESFCYIHHKYEEIRKGSYVCFECQHVYTSAGEIVEAHIVNLKILDTEYIDGEAKVAALRFCPLCLHDWP